MEILGGEPGEIRVGEGIGAATFARASLRRAIVSPEGIASKHRNPKPTKPIAPIELTGPIKPTSRRLLPDRPSDR